MTVFHPRGPSFFELAQQALSSTTRGYDLLAPKFEYTPFRTPDWLLEPFLDLIGGPGSVDAGLDMCCGTGAGVRMLRPACRELVMGIDRSQGMLDQARELLSDQGCPVELVRGDVRELGLSERFDVATCFGAFGHLLPPDQDRWARSTFQALRPGGRFLFLTAPMPSPIDPRWWMARGFNLAMHVRNAVLDPPFIMFYLTFTLERAREVLERNGFEITVHEGLYERAPGVLVVSAQRPA